jgi:hypothetical protein
MAGGKHHSDLVVVARASTLMEADMLRATLDVAGIDAVIPGEFTANALSHLAGGLNPHGMKILVSVTAAEQARDVVQQWYDRREDVNQVDMSCDAWARRAWHAAWMELILPMMIFVAVYCIIKACYAADQAPPTDEARFRHHLTGACILVSLVLSASLLLVIRTYAYSSMLSVGSVLFGLLNVMI